MVSIDKQLKDAKKLLGLRPGCRIVCKRKKKAKTTTQVAVKEKTPEIDNSDLKANIGVKRSRESLIGLEGDELRRAIKANYIINTEKTKSQEKTDKEIDKATKPKEEKINIPAIKHEPVTRHTSTRIPSKATKVYHEQLVMDSSLEDVRQAIISSSHAYNPPEVIRIQQATRPDRPIRPKPILESRYVETEDRPVPPDRPVQTLIIEDPTRLTEAQRENEILKSSLADTTRQIEESYPEIEQARKRKLEEEEKERKKDEDEKKKIERELKLIEKVEQDEALRRRRKEKAEARDDKILRQSIEKSIEDIRERREAFDEIREANDKKNRHQITMDYMQEADEDIRKAPREYAPESDEEDYNKLFEGLSEKDLENPDIIKNIQSQIEKSKEQLRERRRSKIGHGKVGTGMTDHELNDIMKHEPHYQNCISIDEIRTLKPESKMEFIMNKSPSTSEGSHWVACYIDTKDECELDYYDPLADPPQDEFVKDIKKYVIDKLNPDRLLKFKINTVRNQKETTDTCGLQCVNFLRKRNRGMSFKDATGYIEPEIDNSNKYEAEANVIRKQSGFGYI